MIEKKQNEIDNPVMELPMPSFWNFKPNASVADKEKINDLDETNRQMVLEGGEIELRPAKEEFNSDEDVDIFAASASSFMSDKMRRTAEKSFGLDQTADKKSELKNRFLKFGNAGFDEEKFEMKEKAKLEFLNTYASVISLAQQKEYGSAVEERLDELEMIEDAMEHEDYNLQKWLKQYTWELVLSKDLKVYSQPALAYHFIFILRRWILASVIFACT